jgi:gliding motility-associated-like protein
MNLYNKYLFFIPFFLIQNVLWSQLVRKPQFDKWVFSNNCQIDFTSGAPVFSSNGNNVGDETASSYCDANGDIIMYTDGITIYDKTHNSMPSAVIWDGNSSRSGPLIIPFINDPDKYYIFQVDGLTTSSFSGPLGKWDGLYYHIVDMTLNGGLGDISSGQQNIVLIDSVEEALAAVMHENGEDYWVVTRKAHSSKFYAFLVTENGVCLSPVITDIGSVPPNAPNGLRIKFSHDGKQMAVVGGSVKSILLDFDNCSGELSNLQDISPSVIKGYDVVFSPDDNLIYVTHIWGGSPDILQYQRFAPNIPATEMIIGGAVPHGFYPDIMSYSGLRVYGDTIYVGNTDSSFHILSDPNNYGNPGLENHFQFTGGTFNSKMSYNFPNYFDYQYIDKSYAITRDTSICSGDSLEIGGDINCNSTGYDYAWLPSVGLSDPLIANPVAKPNVTTTYVVSVTFICNTTTDTITIHVDPFLDATIISDTLFCENDPVTNLQAQTNGGVWSGNGIINTSDGTFDPLVAGIGTQEIIYQTNGLCDDADTIEINVVEVPSIIYMSQDDSCNLSKGFIDIDVSGGSMPYAYFWSNGAVSEDLLNVSSGLYTLELIDDNECIVLEQIIIQNDLECDNEQVMIYVPNSFSPGYADGVNDEFFPVISGGTISDYEFYIFNRWGELIFNSIVEGEKWDGRFQGEMSPQEVYVWKITFVDDGLLEWNQYNGHVVLLR